MSILPTNPFADVQIDKSNVKLYMETPEEDLTRNVYPEAQQEVLKAKKNFATAAAAASNINFTFSPDARRTTGGLGPLKKPRKKIPSQYQQQQQQQTPTLLPHQQSTLSPSHRPLDFQQSQQNLALPIIGSSLAKSLLVDQFRSTDIAYKQQIRQPNHQSDPFAMFQTAWERQAQNSLHKQQHQQPHQLAISSSTSAYFDSLQQAKSTGDYPAAAAAANPKNDFLKLKYEAMMRKAFAARMRSHNTASQISTIQQPQASATNSNKEQQKSARYSSNVDHNPSNSETRTSSPLGIFLQKGTSPHSVSPRQGSHRAKLINSNNHSQQHPLTQRQVRYEKLYRKMMESQSHQQPSWFSMDYAPLMVQGTTGKPPSDSYMQIKLGSAYNSNNPTKRENLDNKRSANSLRELPSAPFIQSMMIQKQQQQQQLLQHQQQLNLNRRGKTNLLTSSNEMSASAHLLPNLKHQKDSFLSSRQEIKIDPSQNSQNENLIVPPMPSLNKNSTNKGAAKRFYKLGNHHHQNNSLVTNGLDILPHSTTSNSFFEQQFPSSINNKSLPVSALQTPNSYSINSPTQLQNQQKPSQNNTASLHSKTEQSLNSTDYFKIAQSLSINKNNNKTGSSDNQDPSVIRNVSLPNQAGVYPVTMNTSSNHTQGDDHQSHKNHNNHIEEDPKDRQYFLTSVHEKHISAAAAASTKTGANASLRHELKISTDKISLNAGQASRDMSRVSPAAAAAFEFEEEDDNELSSPIMNIHHAIQTLSSAHEDPQLPSKPNHNSSVFKHRRQQSTFSEAEQNSRNNSSHLQSQESKKAINTLWKIDLEKEESLKLNSKQPLHDPLLPSDSQAHSINLPSNQNSQQSVTIRPAQTPADQSQKQVKLPQDSKLSSQSIPSINKQASSQQSQLIIPQQQNSNKSPSKPQDKTTPNNPNIFIFPTKDSGISSEQASPSLSRADGSKTPNINETDIYPGNPEQQQQQQPAADSAETDNNNPPEEGGFVLKRAIDFDKLRELRDKTINRMSYTKNTNNQQQKSPVLQPSTQINTNIGSRRVINGVAQISPKLKNPPNSNQIIASLVSPPATTATTAANNNNAQAKKSLNPLQAAANKLQMGAFFNKKMNQKKGGKKPNQAATSAQGEEEQPEITEAELQERLIEQQRELDRGIASRLELAKDKVRQGIKAAIKDTLVKRSIQQKNNQSHAIDSSQSDATTGSATTAGQTFEEQQKEIQQLSHAVMGFFGTVIDNLNEKGGITAAATSSSSPGKSQTTFSSEFLLRNLPKNFNFNMNEQMVKTIEIELKKSNLSADDVERFKYIYEISTKMQFFYSNMIATFGGIERVKTLIEQVVKKVSSHVTLFPINHVYSFDAMHRRIIPCVCALLCDDHKLFLRTLRAFQATEQDFSFIDFYFIKKQVYSVLSKQHSESISSSLALAVMQKIESVRRFVFPINVLADSSIRIEVSTRLASNQKFLVLFKENSFKQPQIIKLIHRIFDYFYSEVESIDSLEVKSIRVLIEPFLVKKISRKVIDYIEVVTQQALSEDRFTRNVILRDLHYKFTKLRLKLGFKQGIFGIFTFEQNAELIENVRDEVIEQLNNNPHAQSYFADGTEMIKVYDLTYLKSYMRFLLSEYDIFSVYDFSVAMPYLAISYQVFKFWITCMRSVLVKIYQMQMSQVNIFIRFIEACCPSYE